jgi:hypothetical protein
MIESRDQEPAPRRLRIDLAQLVDAFESGSDEVAAYLDVETGEVVWVTGEVRRELEVIDEELPEDLPDGEARKAAIAAAAVERGLPAWMVEPLQAADRVEGGFGTRFIRIPQPEPRDGYEDMEAFIATVGNRRLQEQLWIAIRGQGAFRRFKGLLAVHPTERERWFAFRDARVRDRVAGWLTEEGIEPAREPD